MNGDAAHMKRALTLAANGLGRTGDNPSVGCLIVSGDEIVGEARTDDGGRPHAEEQALAQAGDRARGATAYITLEPCALRSTGAASCADLLIAAGLARVVIATRDPHPNAAGAGLERLRAAGIAVQLGVMEDVAKALNVAFLKKWSQPR